MCSQFPHHHRESESALPRHKWGGDLHNKNGIYEKNIKLANILVFNDKKL